MVSISGLPSDPLGTKPSRIKVQVSARPNQMPAFFIAVLRDGDVGIFVSASGLLRMPLRRQDCKKKRKITLLDNEQLFDLWVEYYEKLKDEDIRHLPLKPL